jgi:hypothetical protein
MGRHHFCKEQSGAAGFGGVGRGAARRTAAKYVHTGAGVLQEAGVFGQAIIETRFQVSSWRSFEKLLHTVTVLGLLDDDPLGSKQCSFCGLHHRCHDVFPIGASLGPDVLDGILVVVVVITVFGVGV